MEKMRQVQKPKTKTKTKSINLIDGCFTTAEAADILYALLDKKINFHKIQRLGLKEGNHADTCVYDNGRIRELMQERETLKSYLLEIRGSGCNLKINSTIEIVIEKQKKNSQ